MVYCYNIFLNEEKDMKTFTYEKANGEISTRTVVPIHPASRNMLAIDLTEYADNERVYYEQEIEKAQAIFRNTIAHIGLGTNWRNFRNDRIIVE